MNDQPTGLSGEPPTAERKQKRVFAFPRLPRLTRRRLLAGAAAGGGLLVAWALWPRTYGGALPTGDRELAFGPWLAIGTDGVVTVALPQLEMGQGVSTLLPQIVATELGADWRQMAVQPVPPDGAYANVPLAAMLAPFWASGPASLADDPGSWPDSWLIARFARSAPFVGTGFGTTLAAYEDECREAAATARYLLASAAAERWGVDWTQVGVENGILSAGGQRLRFGEVAAEAATRAPLNPPPLQSEPYRERVDTLGAAGPTDFTRLDAPAKVDGSLLFAGDIRLPGMVFASIQHGPPGSELLAGFEGDGAAGLRGLVGVVRARHWLAAAADNWWTAERAIEAMRPRFRGAGGFTSARIDRALAAALAGPAVTVSRRELDGADPPARYDIAATYRGEAGVHAPIETASAVARLTDGRLELWLAAQAPEQARAAAAKAAGVALADTVLYPVFAGGSFDARLSHSHAIEAAILARKLQRPVLLTWPRRDETLANPVRAPFAARMVATTGPGGRVEAWRARFAGPAPMRELGHRLFDNYTPGSAIDASAEEADPLAFKDALAPYEVTGLVDHAPAGIDLPTGPMRGNAAALAAFPRECFIDELASRAGREPLSYRIAMLGRNPRLVACLQRAASLAGWDGGRRGGRQGLACVEMRLVHGGEERVGRIACVAEAAAAGGGFEVSRLVAAVDIGRIVNLDLARQQIEGGLIFGLGNALGAAIRFEGGRPTAATLGELNLPTLATSPRIEVSFLDSDAPPFDPGELGTAVAPPAIANAVFAATGRRIRRLPLIEPGTPVAPPPPPPSPPADPAMTDGVEEGEASPAGTAEQAEPLASEEDFS